MPVLLVLGAAATLPRQKRVKTCGRSARRCRCRCGPRGRAAASGRTATSTRPPYRGSAARRRAGPRRPARGAGLAVHLLLARCPREHLLLWANAPANAAVRAASIAARSTVRVEQPGVASVQCCRGHRGGDSRSASSCIADSRRCRPRGCCPAPPRRGAARMPMTKLPARGPDATLSLRSSCCSVPRGGSARRRCGHCHRRSGYWVEVVGAHRLAPAADAPGWPAPPRGTA